jgi:hypothetical protein
MTIHRLRTTIPPPPEAWTTGGTCAVPVELPAADEPLVQWLARRWSIEAAEVGAYLIVAATAGRLLLAQLEAYDLFPGQPQPGVHPSPGCVMLPKHCAELIAETASTLGLRVARHTGNLMHAHIQGKLANPRVTAPAQDDDGAPLRADDTSLKVWLPEGLQSKIDLLADHLELTRSDVIRNALLLHAYGRIRFEAWTEQGGWRPKRKASADETRAYAAGDVRFSPDRSASTGPEAEPETTPGRRVGFIRQHGKSNDGVRVFMPSLLKEKLEGLARVKGLPASEYCRVALVDAI